MNEPDAPADEPTRSDKMHAGTRALQERYGSEEAGARTARSVRADLSADMQGFIERREFFFLATADETGRADGAFRAGPPGFVRALDARTIAFEDFDGNGAFMSLGNIVVNPRVGLLFVDFTRGKRVRVGGVAEVLDGEAAQGLIAGARRVVRVRVTHAHTNCPSHVPFLVRPGPLQRAARALFDWARRLKYRLRP